jgi:hypothetical protein
MACTSMLNTCGGIPIWRRTGFRSSPPPMPKRPLKDPVTKAARGSASGGKVSVLVTKEFGSYMSTWRAVEKDSVPSASQFKFCHTSNQRTWGIDWPTYLAIFVVVATLLISLCVYDIGCEGHGERHLEYSDKPVCYSTRLNLDHALDRQTTVTKSDMCFIWVTDVNVYLLNWEFPLTSSISWIHVQWMWTGIMTRFIAQNTASKFQHTHTLTWILN